jgi:D-3-phosphoglycerate dehydrogenase
MKRAKVVILKFTPHMQRIWGEPLSIERECFDGNEIDLIEIDGTDEQKFIEFAKDAHAILSYGGGSTVSRKVIESLQNCKIIAMPTVGYDSVDIQAATKKNIWVSNTPDISIEEVADHTMVLMLASWRRLLIQDKLVRNGKTAEARPLVNKFPRLYGQTLGFVAFGNIAKAVSHRSKPFGLKMLAYDPYCHETEMVARYVEPVAQLDELLSRSDIISIHAPLTKDTYHMISEKQFRQMKSSAILINTSRGNIVNEKDLIIALAERRIAFAGLDVFENEPIDPKNSLLKMENVILTGHIASGSSRMRVESRRRAVREVLRVLNGEAPISPVNKIIPS